MSIRKKKLSLRSALLLFSLIFASGFFANLSHSRAATALTTLSDKTSRAKINTVSNHEIIFRTPTGAGDTTDTIVITFPTGFAIGSVDYTDIDMFADSSNPPTTEMTLAASASATEWGAAFSSQVLTLTHPSNGSNGDVAANDYVKLLVGTNATGGNAQITNHTDTPGSYMIQVDVKTGGTTDDTGKIAIAVVTDDQVIVTGSVDPSLTFSLTGNATAFGAIPVGSVANGDTNTVITSGTNADNGYIVYVKDAGNGTNPGLYSAETSYIIGSSSAAFANGPTILAGGTEGYGIRAQGTGGTPTIDAPYNNGVAGTVGGLELTQQSLAHHDGNMTANDEITVYYHAARASFTAAGSYTDTITYVASGRF